MKEGHGFHLCASYRYKTNKGKLLYNEYYPNDTDKLARGCCCTQVIKDQPNFEPDSITVKWRYEGGNKIPDDMLPTRNQYMLIHNTISISYDRESKFNVWDSEIDYFWISKWVGFVENPINNLHHDYYVFKKNHIHFEIYLPIKDQDYQFIDIYRGNSVNRSTMYHGHSKPNIKTSVDTENTYWWYKDDLFKGEQFAILNGDIHIIDSLFCLHDRLWENNPSINQSLTLFDQYDYLNNSPIKEVLDDTARFFNNFNIRGMEHKEQFLKYI